MFKNFIIAIIFTLLVSPASANSCSGKVAKIDAALSTGSVENFKKVKTLRDKGEALHKAGKHSDSLAILIEAMKLAGIY